LLICVGAAACRQKQTPPAAVRASAQISGVIHVPGIRAPVTIVHDRWGVPHISAAGQDDLFVAQGFVQAQDRLFQMDLWRRSTQGRLAEVLGSNFVERDIMTRRVQFEGDGAADWASCGPDARAIAASFVAGINAWVGIARDQLPEEFALAGWRPDYWTPDDLLNRTDAFLESGDALTEVLRARVVHAVGAREADAWLPGRTVVPHGLDIAAIRYGAADALRRIGTRPFFTTVRGGGSNAWVVAGRRSATGMPLLASDPHRAFDNPSHTYVVHLRAPGWNVIGATVPWLPGVAAGHNERVAWGMTALPLDVQDLFVERINPQNPHQVEERGRWIDTRRSAGAIAVKGREKPFAFEFERTARGPVIAIDREQHLAFTLRWIGGGPGTAEGLGATAIDRAHSATELRAALARWNAPPVEVIFADADGEIGRQAAGLRPVRRGWDGALPAPAWSGVFAWTGTAPPADRDGRAGDHLISANRDAARASRIEELIAARERVTSADFQAWQHDVVSWTARRLVPLLARVRGAREDVEAARLRLLAWDKRVSADSPVAALYVRWERAIIRALAEGALGPSLARDYMDSVTNAPPSLADRLRGRDPVLLDALAAALGDESTSEQPWGARHTALFAHPLAVTADTRRRFNVGRFSIGGYAGTVMLTSGRGPAADIGPSFRQILDVANWDRSLATNPPGQSGSPASAHFADLARTWAAGEYFPLVFSDEAVKANAEATLVLVPR
jgi:penicillin amidase